MIHAAAVFAYFYCVVMGAILMVGAVIAWISLARDWFRDRRNPGAREFYMDAHPAGGRFGATDWDSELAELTEGER